MKKVLLVGNLTKDAEIKEISGANYVSMSVASDEGSKERATTIYYDVLMRYGQNAIYNPAELYNKGREVLVEGRETCRIDEYNGNVNIRYTIWADNVKPLRGGMKERQQSNYDNDPNAPVQIFPERNSNNDYGSSPF